MRAANICKAVLLGALCFTSTAQGQTKSEQALLAGRAALRRQQYTEAIHLLEDGLKSSPSDQSLKFELGRAYLYSRQDDRAIQLFQEVLREEPSNQRAKLELARAFGYQRNYAASDRLYRELLKTNPDEAAAAGLIRNLMHEGKTVEARHELERALAHNPNSTQLQEYKRRLEQQQGRGIGDRRRSARSEPKPAAWEKQERLTGTVSYLTDSSGNHSWRSSQQFDYAFASRFGLRTQMEERSLWKRAGPKANVLWATNDLEFHPTRTLLLYTGGGAVRFSNGGSRPLYRGELELHPVKGLWVSGGFSRTPISPTFRATQFNLLAEGWHARLDWAPRGWRTYATWSSQHYSDGNHAQRADSEIVRWLGTPQFAIAAGYRASYISFSQTLLHGYFDPSRYQSHLGVTGVRFSAGKRFRAEYVARMGVESISGAPYQNAWEVVLRNRVLLRQWELGGDYSYFHLAQNTGAFRAQSGRFVIVHRF